MEQIVGIGLLVLLLTFFTVFTYYAPHGDKAMGALAAAAIATFLVEALQSFVIGDIFSLGFFQEAGTEAGLLSGVIVAFLVALTMGVNPLNSAIIAVSCGGIGLIPGFFAAYLISFVVKYMERNIPNGLDFIVVVIVIVPITRLIGLLLTPLVDASLLNIGNIIVVATEASPILMGLLLGGIITVVGTSPLSSMALTALLGLTGIPMAVGSLAAFGSAFINGTLFHKLKIGNMKSVLSVAVEPLSKADVVSANPIPIYITNFVGGGLSGVVIAYSGLVNDAPGTATPTAGLLVLFGYNPAMQVIIYAVIVAVISGVIGYIGSHFFRNYPVRNTDFD
ncbi:PTS sugar transporter subunit IIC [Salinicoccus hispanicus]|uniref:PTS sugar transporter subunit IIC n=1 Tax=Salinicoccus hispanicus TaxID=157225 RepID=A0A6N8U1V3_9STAP|nr:PTS sugar transporter subunit IIC [Salinicoccus hispanicus]MXQ51693.1 PTS sugar transporter subunit IIC [Salinicoccus hispanicus]